MATHSPEGWIVLKVTSSKETYYRVFGTWRGGYLGSDSWRLSSGADSLSTIESKGKELIWPQDSGSIYSLHIGGQGGTSAYTQGVLNQLLKSAEKGGASVSVVRIQKEGSKWVSVESAGKK